MAPSDVDRWNAVCGALPGGATAYTYVAEHCRRKRTSAPDAERLALLRKDLDETRELLTGLTRIVDEQSKIVQRAPLAHRWNGSRPIQAAEVNARLEAIAAHDRAAFQLFRELPVLIARLHEALLAMHPTTGTVEQRYGRLRIPKKFDAERELVALGVLRAFEVTRQRQVADMVVTEPANAKAAPSKTQPKRKQRPAA